MAETPVLDKLLRIAARHRVDWQAVDVHAFVWDNLRTAVNRAAETVEHAAEHILGYAKLHLAAEEAHLAVGEVDARGALEQLDKRIDPSTSSTRQRRFSPLSSSISPNSL